MTTSKSNIKAAVAKWEEKNGKKVSSSKEIKLSGQIPPIERLDGAMNLLSHVEKLSLATNSIEKITSLTYLKRLKVLSLGRNNIKSLTGLEQLSDSLEELWISYNQIEKLIGIGTLQKLKVLYMSNNLVKDLTEFQRLNELPSLCDLLFVGNPLEEKLSADGSWRTEATKRLPGLKKLDGVPVVRIGENGRTEVLQLLQAGNKDDAR